MTQFAERLIWFAIVLLIVVGGVLYERHVGAQRCLLNVKQANVKEESKEAVQRTADQGTVAREGKTYEKATSAPVVIRAPIIRLCPDFHSETLPASSTARSEADAETTGRREGQGRTATWDSTPVVRAGRDADAQIAGLQDYILKVCRPK